MTKAILRVVKYGLPFAGGYWLATQVHQKQTQAKIMFLLIFIIIGLILALRWKK